MWLPKAGGSVTPREANEAADKRAAKARRRGATGLQLEVIDTDLWLVWVHVGACAADAPAAACWFLTMDGSVQIDRAGPASCLWHCTREGHTTLVAVTLFSTVGITAFVAECIALLNAVALMQNTMSKPCCGWMALEHCCII